MPRKRRSLPPDAKVVAWDPGQEEKLSRHLSGLINADGKNWTWMLGHEHVLRASIELRGVDSDWQRRQLIRAAFARLKSCKRQDLKTFRRVLAGQVRRNTTRPLTRFRVLFPLNARENDLAGRRGTVLGTRFSFTTWSRAEQKLALDDWRAEVRQYLTHSGTEEPGVGPPWAPVIAEVDARHHDEAARTASDSYLLLRTALNMVGSFGATTSQAGLARPLGKFVAPPVFGVFVETGSMVGGPWAENVIQRGYTPWRVTDDDWDTALSYLRYMRAPTRDNDIQSILLDGWRKYGEALQTSDWQAAFLMLWQVLEGLTFRPGDRFSMREVEQRAVLLLSDKAEVRELFNALAATRNQLVHMGRFSDDGLDYVNLLKLFVEDCLSETIRLRKRFKTAPRLFDFYRLLPQRGTNLERSMRAARDAKSFRRARKRP